MGCSLPPPSPQTPGVSDINNIPSNKPHTLIGGWERVADELMDLEREKVLGPQDLRVTIHDVFVDNGPSKFWGLCELGRQIRNGTCCPHTREFLRRKSLNHLNHMALSLISGCLECLYNGYLGLPGICFISEDRCLRFIKIIQGIE